MTVLEKNGYVGGRNCRETVGECQFDGGPTLLMMLDPFRKLFADVGEVFEQQVPITLCDPSYRVFFADGTRFEGTTDRDRMYANILEMSGAAEAAKYPGFLTELQELYEAAIPNFVRKNYRSLADFAGPRQLARVLKHRMLGNLAKRVANRFEDPRLRMLFTFQTMYLGLSPNDAPWVYGTLTYMEYGEGIYYPHGGLAGISESIAELAAARGAEIRLHSPVRSVSGKTIVLEDGEVIEADAVIANADMPYAERELHNQPSDRDLRYSCSSHLMYIDYAGELPPLEHHNVMFGADFEANLDALFHDLRVPEDPAFYVCVSKRSDPSLAPDGHLNLFVLIPVPNLDCPMSDTEVADLEAKVLARLTREAGFEATKVQAVKRRGPTEWQSQFNLDRGAAFGISHDLFQSAFMRPQNRSRTNPDLYFVGASTVPGNGLPMVLISAELVEQRLVQEGVLA